MCETPRNQFEFILGTASSPRNQKRIRHHISHDSWRQRRNRSAKALHLAQPLPGARSSNLTLAEEKPLPKSKYVPDQHGDLQQGTVGYLSRVRQRKRCSESKSQFHEVSTVVEIGAGLLDPFNVTVVPVNGELSAYITFFASSMWPAHPVEGSASRFLRSFGSFAFQDEALLYAIAASAAARQAPQCRSWASQSVHSSSAEMSHLVYSNKAINAIRRKLSRESEDVASDATIGVIAFLAMCEAVDSGNVSHCNTHIMAVEGLVRLRGGHEKISRLWYERILAADLKAACVSMSMPRLACPEDELVDQSIKFKLRDRERTLASAMLTDESQSFLSQECVSLIVKLRDLSLFRAFSPQQEVLVNHSTADVFSHQRLVIENQILVHTLSKHQFQQHPIEPCLCLAMLIYLNTAIWLNFQPSCAILRKPCILLRLRLLEMGDVQTFLATSMIGGLEIILAWLMFIGAFASKNELERLWFTTQLGIVIHAMQLNTEDELRAVLLKTFYVESIFDDALVLIFYEATRVPPQVDGAGEEFGR